MLGAPTALVAVEVFSPTRTQLALKLLIASRVRARRLKNLEFGVTAALSQTDDLTRQPMRLSCDVYLRDTVGPRFYGLIDVRPLGTHRRTSWNPRDSP